MKEYIGTMRVTAELVEATRDIRDPLGIYSSYRVKFDVGLASLMPQQFFERYFHPVTDPMSFGSAMKVLMGGGKVARKGWEVNRKSLSLEQIALDYEHGYLLREFINQEGMYLCLVENDCNDKSSVFNCIGMQLPNGDIQLDWTPSQEDMLAEDWIIVE